jgi:PAS domain S-box-containing protein
MTTISVVDSPSEYGRGQGPTTHPAQHRTIAAEQSEVRTEAPAPGGELEAGGELKAGGEEQAGGEERAEAEAQAELRRLRAVLDGAPDAYVAIDPGGAVIGWNASAERMFGYRADEALGRPVTGLIIPERYHAMHTAGMARVRASGRSLLAGQRLHLAALDRTGREFPAEMTLQVTAGPDALVFHAFVHDLTARSIVLAELDRQRRGLDDALAVRQQVVDLLGVTAAGCDAAGRPTFASRALRELPGAEEALRRPDGVLNRALAGTTVAGETLAVGERTFVVDAHPVDAADGRRLGAIAAVRLP